MKHSSPYFSSQITLQLRDGTTNKLIQEEVGKNFTANQAVRYAKYLQRSQFKSGLASIGGTDTDYPQHSASSSLVLTNSSLTPDPTNEWTMPGQLVGYANKTDYAGTDTFLGTPNANQLDAQPGYTKWVFDWPTHAGNGTINSVGWCATTYASSLTDWRALASSYLSTCTIEQNWSTPQNWRYFARANTNLSFGNTANTVVYVLNSTFQQTTTFNVNGQFTAVRGLAWDSGNSFLWVIGDNGGARRIAAYNSAGVLQTGPYTTTTRSYYSLTHDGTKLWSLTNSNENHTAWSISTANGSDVSNFNFTTFKSTQGSYGGYNQATGLCWDSTNQRLWIKTSYNNSLNWDNGEYPTVRSSAMYAYDTSGNQVAINVSLLAWNPTANGYTALCYPPSTLTDVDIIDQSQFITILSSNMYRFRLDGMGTRYKLDSPVVKNNTQTLKVIYQINYI
jgi:hypothetical protein